MNYLLLASRDSETPAQSEQYEQISPSRARSARVAAQQSPYEQRQRQTQTTVWQPVPALNVPLLAMKIVLERLSVHCQSPQSLQHRLVHLSGTHSFARPTADDIRIEMIADKFPELIAIVSEYPHVPYFLVKLWADLSYPPSDDWQFLMSSRYESVLNIQIEIIWNVYASGHLLVERVDQAQGVLVQGRYVYEVSDAAVCAYLTTVIDRLARLQSPDEMNLVLEKLTVTQVLLHNCPVFLASLRLCLNALSDRVFFFSRVFFVA
eukprot:m.295385 g.295385  ORF g.295385 m.295385 type:complete len:264 (-) comp55150_c0_seq6:462-1253(-)